jgi:hypothetical protein
MTDHIEDIGWPEPVGLLHGVELYVAQPGIRGPCTEEAIMQLRDSCARGLRQLRSVTLTPEQWMELRCDLITQHGDDMRLAPPREPSPESEKP